MSLLTIRRHNLLGIHMTCFQGDIGMFSFLLLSGFVAKRSLGYLASSNCSCLMEHWNGLVTKPSVLLYTVDFYTEIPSLHGSQTVVLTASLHSRWPSDQPEFLLDHSDGSDCPLDIIVYLMVSENIVCYC